MNMKEKLAKQREIHLNEGFQQLKQFAEKVTSTQDFMEGCGFHVICRESQMNEEETEILIKKVFENEHACLDIFKDTLTPWSLTRYLKDYHSDVMSTLSTNPEKPSFRIANVMYRWHLNNPRIYGIEMDILKNLPSYDNYKEGYQMNTYKISNFCCDEFWELFHKSLRESNTRDDVCESLLNYVYGKIDWDKVNQYLERETNS